MPKTEPLAQRRGESQDFWKKTKHSSEYGAAQNSLQIQQNPDLWTLTIAVGISANSLFQSNENIREKSILKLKL